MWKANLLLVFSVFLMCSPFVLAQGDNPQDLFQQGTQSYLSKDYPKARDLFQSAVEKDPYNSSLLTNLALAQFQLGNKAVAVGLLRKALAYDPELPTAQQGLKFVLSQMELKEVPHQLEFSESLHKNLLQPFPTTAYLVIVALLMFASGWSLLSFMDRRKKALQQESALPSYPFIATFFSISFVLFTCLLALKIHDSNQVRGTIITEKEALQTAPGENQASVLDLYGGNEVLVLELDGDWAQVTYPGSLTGWIKKSSLLMTR